MYFAIVFAIATAPTARWLRLSADLRKTCGSRNCHPFACWPRPGPYVERATPLDPDVNVEEVSLTFDAGFHVQ